MGGAASKAIVAAHATKTAIKEDAQRRAHNWAGRFGTLFQMRQHGRHHQLKGVVPGGEWSASMVKRHSRTSVTSTPREADEDLTKKMNFMTSHVLRHNEPTMDIEWSKIVQGGLAGHSSMIKDRQLQNFSESVGLEQAEHTTNRSALAKDQGLIDFAEYCLMKEADGSLRRPLQLNDEVEQAK